MRGEKVFNRSIIRLELLSNRKISFKYNQKYLTVSNGNIINKTEEKRYFISFPFFAQRTLLFLEREVPEKIQIIIFTNKEKVLVNKNDFVLLKGRSYIMLQFDEEVAINIAELINIFSVVKTNKLLQGSTLKKDRINNRVLLAQPSIEQQIKEMRAVLTQSVGNTILYIGDDFTYKNLQGVGNVVNIAYHELDTLEYVLIHFSKEIKIDFAFVESLWEGKENSFFFQSREKKNQAMLDFITICKRQRIKTIFYNKEDPVHFTSFLPVAKQVNLVITTDKERVKDYQREQIKNVYYDGFFVNTKIFNPFGSDINAMKEIIFFAGSHYPNYQERSEFIQNTFLQFANDFGLEIIDRNRDKINGENKFPKNLRPYITKGSLDIEDLIIYTKKFKYALNLNSVINSDTMIARRVYEQLALGKIVVSNYALSIEKAQLPGVIFDKNNDYKNIRQKMLAYEENEQERLERSLNILREYSAETFIAKAKSSLNIIAKDCYVYLKINTEYEYQKALEMLKMQTYQNYIFLIETEDTTLCNLVGGNAECITANQNHVEYASLPVIVFDVNKNYKDTALLDAYILSNILGEKYQKISFNAGKQSKMFTKFSQDGLCVFQTYKCFREKQEVAQIGVSFSQEENN